MKRQMIAAGMVLVILLASGCSDSKPLKASKAASFPEGVCAAIFDWQNSMVDVANAFTDETRRLNESARRARYLFAFDEQRRITEDLRAQLDAVPATGVSDADAIREELQHAVDDVEANIAAQKADAAANVDFSFLGPKPDRLFVGNEKSLSLMLKPLDAISEEHGVAALGGKCGRVQ